MIRAALVVLVACGQPSPPVTTLSQHRPAPPDAAIAVDATLEPYGPPIALPGCTDSDKTIKAIEALAASLHAPTTDAKVFLDELKALLDTPCLRHVKPAFVFPANPSIERLRAAFDWGIEVALSEAAKGIGVRWGRQVQVIPPGLHPDLTAKQKQSLDALRCRANDNSCAAAASYILRAERAFDVRLASQLDGYRPRTGAWPHYEMPLEQCANWQPRDPDQVQEPSTYESWVSCAAARVPTTIRFAERNLAAPARGWLVLRGQRGHYSVDDELRVYDLATGAAYVASHVHLFGSQPGKQPGMHAYTGRVDPGQVREVAFMLLARDALVNVRTVTFAAPVPDTLSRALTKDGAFTPQSDWPRVIVTDSGETSIDYLYRDGTTRLTGDFTWPQSFGWPDTHIVDLIEVLEAGLVRACAPAKLPEKKLLEIPPSTNPALVTALEGLRSGACKGAK